MLKLYVQKVETLLLAKSIFALECDAQRLINLVTDEDDRVGRNTVIKYRLAAGVLMMTSLSID